MLVELLASACHITTPVATMTGMPAALIPDAHDFRLEVADTCMRPGFQHEDSFAGESGMCCPEHIKAETLDIVVVELINLLSLICNSSSLVELIPC